MHNFDCPYSRATSRDFWRALAHLALDLAARLPLHPAGRQPARHGAHLPQPDDHHAARRAVARRGLELRRLGRLHGAVCACTAAGPALDASRTRAPAPAGDSARRSRSFVVVALALLPLDISATLRHARVTSPASQRRAIGLRRCAIAVAASCRLCSIGRRSLSAGSCASHAGRGLARWPTPPRCRDLAASAQTRPTLHLLPVLMDHGQRTAPSNESWPDAWRASRPVARARSLVFAASMPRCARASCSTACRCHCRTTPTTSPAGSTTRALRSDQGRVDVLFLGSSVVRAGVRPTVFDESSPKSGGGEVVSFNGGLSNMFPPAPKLYLEHVWLDAAKPRFVLHGVREVELAAQTERVSGASSTAGIESQWLERSTSSPGFKPSCSRTCRDRAIPRGPAHDDRAHCRRHALAR